jgi:outer membrane protein OmpA-like peptidoglycan-associated protein
MALQLYLKSVFIYLIITLLSASHIFVNNPTHEINRFSASSNNSAFFAPNANGSTYKIANGSRETVNKSIAKPSAYPEEIAVVKRGVTMLKTDEIFFDFDKSSIRKDAAEALDKLVDVLNANKSIIIRIEAHADSRGSDEYNLKLSDRRAKSSRDYLVEKGIHPDRIVSAKGFGESKLVNECGDGIECSEAAHQLNRRSEFIILNP